MPRLSFACLLAVAASIAAPVWAAPVIFTGVDSGSGSTNPRPNANASAAAFDAAVSLLGTEQIITFELETPGAYTSLTVAPGVTLTGTDIFGNAQTILNASGGTPDSLFGFNTTAGGQKFASITGGFIQFAFATPIQAFGAYLSGVQISGETITFNDGSSQTVNIPDPGGAGGVEFVGFTAAGAQISSVKINATGDFIGVDDVRFVVPNLPEPMSAMLLSVGLLGLGVARRRGNGRPR